MNSSGRRNFRRGRGYLFRGNGRGQGNRHVRGKGSPSTPAQRDTIESRNVFHQTTLVGRCPFRDWRAYFPDDVYIPNSSLDRKIHTFQNYIETGIGNYSQDEIEAQGSMTIDFKDLVSNSDVIEKIPNLAEELKDNPNKTIQALSLAAYQVFAAGYDSLSQPDCQTPFELPQIQARIFNYDPVTPLKNLKASCYGKFVAIVGTVVRVSCIKPLVTQMAFVCNMCKETQVLAFADGKYRVPTKCESDACRARTFIPQQSSPLTKTIDWQTVKIQEIKDDDQREAGRIPRTVECELEADLVDSAVPGDIVKICGEVKVTDAEESKTRQKDKCMFQLYISANSVENFKATRKATESGNDLVAEFTLKELYAIQEIQAEKNLFRLIVGSVCPSIYGRELVKAGLVLGLFGGCQRFENDKNRVPVRGNPHVLVVGDPGLGKSQMLRAVSNLAPRGVYVCGNTTSAAGLTVTLHKETSSGESALEAGALVLADQGCCCIDEFDKMGSQHQALLEAMEQQTISIAKAGMVCSLPARTSILAAANPAGGHYNKAKTVSENLRMGSAILSRFDLVFIMLDKPDEEMDCVLSEHVMAIHSGKKSPFETVTVRRNHQNSVLDQNDDELRAQWEADKPLSERLKVGADEDFDPIPSVLLRKYIAYARKYVKPKLSSEAAAELQKFYVNLRKNHQGQDTTPITTRQLESLIRVTEARARLELREQVTKQDALDVIEIMKKSLVDTFTDEIGSLDFQRSQNGSGMSRTAQAKRFIAELEKIAERKFNSLFTVEQLKQLATDMKLNFGSLSFNDFIFSLNNQNYLLKKGARVYQLQTSCCL